MPVVDSVKVVAVRSDVESNKTPADAGSIDTSSEAKTSARIRRHIMWLSCHGQSDTRPLIYRSPSVDALQLTPLEASLWIRQTARSNVGISSANN